MKNITRQYQDLLEGKMSQATFMVNVRRQFPDWISSTNSFKDAVTILKGKRIITEGIHDTNLTIGKEKTIKTYTQNGDKSYNVTYSDDTEKTVMVSDDEWDAINAKAHPELKEVGEKVAAAAMWKGEAAKAKAKKAIKEAEEKTEGKYKSVNGKDLLATFREIDRVNPYEFKRGIAVEMGMQYDPTPNFFTTKFNPETLDKATKKVMANLKKDPAYYTNSLDMATKEKFGMSTKAPEVSKVYDGMIKAKGLDKVVANTKTNLGNQEKRKGNPQGVKQLKEEFLREFAEDKVKPTPMFGKGQAVVTHTGKTGNITELSGDGTATVQFEDGSEEHVQTNVLKVPHGYKSSVKVQTALSAKEKEEINKLVPDANYSDDDKEVRSNAAKANIEQALKVARGEVSSKSTIERKPGIGLQSKLKEMMKKMMDEMALVVPKNATQQQIDQLAQKDTSIKTGTNVDIIRK